MKKVCFSFFQVFRQIQRDSMLFLAGFTPILVGVLIKLGLPALEQKLGISLSPYYLIFDLFLSIMAPMLLCFSFAMITLEELDDKIARYFSITPLGKSGYMISRLGIPAFGAALITIVILLFFSLLDHSLIMVICLAFMGALQAIMVSLMIITLSSNKLEGMAVTKLASLTVLGILAPFFIVTKVQFAVCFLPSFWVSKAALTGRFLYFLLALLAAGIWCGLLGRRLIHKLAG